MLQYTQFKKISLKSHSEFNEQWIQDRIADDPSILGLGDLILKDKERIQPGSGRLDLLLQDPEGNQRYEVELQLGPTDESHIIRTIEYWDIERRRYPQYDHTAVIVAEDITSRFLNVISLFNGFIPIVAIQMMALAHEASISLVFTKVLDQMTLGPVGEDEDAEVVDRSYWEKRASEPIMAMVDKVHEIIREVAPGYELKYNKFHIGLAKDGRTNNFAVLRPRKSSLRLEIRMNKIEELENKIEDSGLDLIDYSKWGRYRIRLARGDVEQHKTSLAELLQQGYTEGSR